MIEGSKNVTHFLRSHGARTPMQSSGSAEGGSAEGGSAGEATVATVPAVAVLPDGRKERHDEECRWH